MIDLHVATGSEKWLIWARTLAGRMHDLFYDEDRGGFFDTTAETPHLIVRTKELYGGARPSGNAMAVYNLRRLYEITGQSEYERWAEQTTRQFGSQIEQGPFAAPTLLSALIARFEGESAASASR